MQPTLLHRIIRPRERIEFCYSALRAKDEDAEALRRHQEDQAATERAELLQAAERERAEELAKPVNLKAK